MREAIERNLSIRRIVDYGRAQLTGLGIINESELEGSLISARLWSRYQQVAGIHQGVIDANRQETELEQEAEREYHRLRRIVSRDDPMIESAYVTWKAQEKKASAVWHKSHETAKPLFQSYRDISRDLVTRHWSELTVIERRAVDVTAGDNVLGRDNRGCCK